MQWGFPCLRNHRRHLAMMVTAMKILATMKTTRTMPLQQRQWTWMTSTVVFCGLAAPARAAGAGTGALAGTASRRQHTLTAAVR